VVDLMSADFGHSCEEVIGQRVRVSALAGTAVQNQDLHRTSFGGCSELP